MDTTSLWLDEIIKLGEKQKFSTVPPRIFEELKALGMVSGTYDACKPTGAANKILIERRGNGTNKGNGGSAAPTKKRKGVSNLQKKNRRG